MARQLTDPQVERVVRSLRAHAIERFELVFVLGSGLGSFADALEHPRAVPFGEIDGLPQSRVGGHAGRLVLGELAGKRVLAQQGRVHLYEGWSAREVARSIRAFAALGCRGFVLTNAAGGLRPEWKPGTLMAITDHLNMQGRTALVPSERGSANPYSPSMRAALMLGARERGLELAQGVYAGLLGPNYETPAEIRALRAMGADAVGMSTVIEAAVAFACGAQVAGISLISNHAAGIAPGKLDHADVLAAGRAAEQRFGGLLQASAPHLLAAL
jgi:purine-nucleoside phosphorylase